MAGSAANANVAVPRSAVYATTDGTLRVSVPKMRPPRNLSGLHKRRVGNAATTAKPLWN